MNKLFPDFPKVSKLEWEEKLTKELKGADFNSSLRRNDEVEELEEMDEDEKEQKALEWLQDRTTVLELDNGGVVFVQF